MALFLFASALFTGCNDKDDVKYAFVGDSFIARWDIEASYPSKIVFNYGKSGSGLDYIQTVGSKLSGSYCAVVLCGTNNLVAINQDANAYARLFVEAIETWPCERIIVLGLLPRDFGPDAEWFNDQIVDYNKVLKLTIGQSNAKDRIVFANFHDYFTGPDGKLAPEYTSDGLHLNFRGYELLTYLLTPYL